MPLRSLVSMLCQIWILSTFSQRKNCTKNATFLCWTNAKTKFPKWYLINISFVWTESLCFSRCWTIQHKNSTLFLFSIVTKRRFSIQSLDSLLHKLFQFGFTFSNNFSLNFLVFISSFCSLEVNHTMTVRHRSSVTTNDHVPSEIRSECFTKNLFEVWN